MSEVPIIVELSAKRGHGPRIYKSGAKPLKIGRVNPTKVNNLDSSGDIAY
jgi:hypothetical protein